MQNSKAKPLPHAEHAGDVFPVRVLSVLQVQQNGPQQRLTSLHFYGAPLSRGVQPDQVFDDGRVLIRRVAAAVPAFCKGWVKVGARRGDRPARL